MEPIQPSPWMPIVPRVIRGATYVEVVGARVGHRIRIHASGQYYRYEPTADVITVRSWFRAMRAQAWQASVDTLLNERAPWLIKVTWWAVVNETPIMQAAMTRKYRCPVAIWLKDTMIDDARLDQYLLATEDLLS